MKSRQVAPSFQGPRFIGRSESDMVAEGQWEQLELFRKTLTPRTVIQFFAMLGLSDPKHLDRPQRARVADIARTMGYEQKERKDGMSVFPSWIYEAIEETGMNLRRHSFDVSVREPAGMTKDGRRKYRSGLVNLSLFSEFGWYYEDEETGQPINLDNQPKEDLIVYDGDKAAPRYAIPARDKGGKIIKNKDGTPQRRPANGVWWELSPRVARLTQDRETSWIIYAEALVILNRYISKPTTFRLMIKTLFWTGRGGIEFGHDPLVEHLGIRRNDRAWIQKTIDGAFADMLKEGIIDKPVQTRPAKYYQPTKKTGRPRRVGKVYQWRRSARWNPGRDLIALELEGDEAGKAEKPNS